ncbi:antitoxin Xre-like helix-turn-helix domain-containing protein [uncultured Sunxiuqinia sp.]|uniref:type II RES/Xre toxin-antitoxin system antitoxin n=1 Tax=uncultured Sunxiuqinia sp. TaxID=1573825 RepID=UPI0030D83063|tara:strand:+ start:149 stop:541 length:393 start_codon:yes stop_codon:yes gene_type:complete
MNAIKYIKSERSLIEYSRKGIEKTLLMDILSQANLSLNEFASYLHISSRMIQKKGQHEKFSPAVSERALYIARLYSRGETIFGDLKKFSEWMNTENPSMGGVRPKSFLDTYSGIQLLMNKLNGIAHGFPA